MMISLVRAGTDDKEYTKKIKILKLSKTLKKSSKTSKTLKRAQKYLFIKDKKESKYSNY